jgi:hypothetical protein
VGNKISVSFGHGVACWIGVSIGTVIEDSVRVSGYQNRIFYEVPEVSVTVTLVCDVLAEVNVSWIASMSGCPLELLETLVPHKGCCECH